MLKRTERKLGIPSSVSPQLGTHLGHIYGNLTWYVHALMCHDSLETYARASVEQMGFSTGTKNEWRILLQHKGPILASPFVL